jgi:hypothetical protein
MDNDDIKVLKQSADAMQRFHRRFGLDLSDSKLCEVYVALRFDLPLPGCGNVKGYDLQSSDGTRYQVKCRGAGTLNLDLNNFEFDFVVLVNLSEDFLPAEMWKLGVEKARVLAADRGKFRKFQIRQRAFKSAADPIDISGLRESLQAVALAP